MTQVDDGRPAAADAPWQADFDAFVREHLAVLRATVARGGRRYRQEPDDALQEALLRAYASRDTFESEQHAVNWICRVARDLLCDQRRSWYGRRVTVSDTMPEAAFGTAPDPADVVAGRDTDRHVLRAVAALSPDHRLLLWQHAVDGRSYAEIARETARPLATVRSIALRARAHARRQLAAGESSLGIGAGLRLRARAWWARTFALPAEQVAAVVVLALPLALGTAGAAPAAGAQPPAVALRAPRAVARAALGPSGAAAPRSGPVRTGTRPSPAAAAHPGPGGTPGGPDGLSPGNGATSGERWGSCAFDDLPANDPSVVGRLAAGGYDCHVEAASTACRTVADDEIAADEICSWVVRGDFAGKAKVPGPLRLCDPKFAEGTLDITFAGVGSYRVPVRLFLNDDGVDADAELDLGDRLVSMSLVIPYVCTEDNPRASVVTGRVSVHAR